MRSFLIVLLFLSASAAIAGPVHTDSDVVYCERYKFYSAPELLSNIEYQRRRFENSSLDPDEPSLSSEYLAMSRLKYAISSGNEREYLRYRDELIRRYTNDAGSFVDSGRGVISFALLEAALAARMAEMDDLPIAVLDAALSKVTNLEPKDAVLFKSESKQSVIRMVQSIRYGITPTDTDGADDIDDAFELSVLMAFGALELNDYDLMQESSSSLKRMLDESHLQDCNLTAAGYAQNLLSKVLLRLAKHKKVVDPMDELKFLKQAEQSSAIARRYIDAVYHPRLWATSYSTAADIYDGLSGVAEELSKSSREVAFYRKLRDQSLSLAVLY